MQKIMFNDQYGLTQAVLEGRKPLTRRIIHLTDTDKEYLDTAFDWDLRERVIIDRYAKYKVGEVVAVAQSYKDIGYTKYWVESFICPNPNAKSTDPFEKKYPGWNNKMFVKAKYMPRKIQISGNHIERLQDISDEDCLREGISWDYADYPYMEKKVYSFNDYEGFQTPRLAFATLINRINSKSTWEINPWVFAYAFELVK